jgi:hypothetical protein
MRIVALGCIDILITLPFAIVVRVLRFIPTPGFPKDDIPWYQGLAWTHSNWYPSAFTYAEMKAGGPASLFTFYFGLWTSVVLGFAIFGLFGASSDARITYWRVSCAVRRAFGWDVSARRGPIVTDMVFSGRGITTVTTAMTANVFDSRSVLF